MRIVNQEYDPAIPVDLLHDHPDNPRKGDDDAVEESVGKNGFYGAVLVQKSTGLVIAGHTRLRVAKKQGVQTIPGFWLDVDDENARRILLADNRTSDLAFYDDDKLLEALSKIIDADDTLLGTGYDDATYKMLLGKGESDDMFVGNTHITESSSERSAAYEASGIRSVILPFAEDEHDRVVQMLFDARKRYDLDTNSEVVAFLLDKDDA